MTTARTPAAAAEARPAGLRLEVHGIPAPQGSKNVGAHGQLYESSPRLRAWRDAVHAAVSTTLRRRLREPLFTGPVHVRVTFTVPHLRKHYRTGRLTHLLRDDAPALPIEPPDLDKTVRATLDPLTEAKVWQDDAQVVQLTAAKYYPLCLASPDRSFTSDTLRLPGAVIRITAVTS